MRKCATFSFGLLFKEPPKVCRTGEGRCPVGLDAGFRPPLELTKYDIRVTRMAFEIERDKSTINGVQMKARTALQNLSDIAAAPVNMSRTHFIARIAFAIICGVVLTYLFKLSIYDGYLGLRKFPDYGPTLFSGGQPDKLLYLYIVLVAVSTLLGLALLKYFKYMPLLDKWAASGASNIIGTITLLLMFTTVSIAALVTGGTHTSHFKIVLFLLTGFGVATFFIRRSLGTKLLNDLVAVSEATFSFLFAAIVLFHLPKIPVLNAIFQQSANKGAAIGLFFGMITLATTISYFLTRSSPRSTWLKLSILLVGVYVVSIREAWINWGVDAFHEGESFLTANYLINGSYKFLADFFPVHGLGRNILHGYFAAIFSDNNLYFYRAIKAITYPFVHVLIFAFLYRYTKKFSVPLAFFVLSYLLGIVEELDIEPFVLLAFILVPLSGNSNKQHWGRVGAGIALFLASIYSFEYFILLNIGMFVTFVHYLYIGNRAKLYPTPWLHISFYGCILIFVAVLGSNIVIWLDIVRNALAKSPNLLERSLESPRDFSILFFFISAFFAPFLLFNITSIVSFIRKQKYTNTLATLVAVFSMLSLMFFVRAFNRSDIGHVLYGHSISIPVIIGLAIYYKAISDRAVILISLALLTIQGTNTAINGQLSMDVLKQRPGYDARLSRNDVRALQEFGAIKVPSGTIDGSHMTAAELVGLQSLVKEGYRIFDMTNEPVLIYGAVNSPLVAKDIHTLFYNTYREQLEVVSRLKASGKTVVLWSAGHWSETLDSTYVEYRLPLVSEYIIRAFPMTYGIGRYVIYAQQELPVGGIVNYGVRNHYDLGLAPSRMTPYRQERVSTLMENATGNVKISEKKPDAIYVDVGATGGGRIFINLKNQGKNVCSVAFIVPRGDSKNFIRLSNLPAYIRNHVDEIDVSAGDAGSKINKISLAELNAN